jgi:hypothetical protein
MQKLIFLIVFLSLGFTLFAQNRKILTPDGKLHPINEVKRVKQFNKVGPQTKKFNLINNINGTIDTLRPPGPYASNAFVHYGQDVMLQWYRAPADMFIYQVGFACKNITAGLEQEVQVKIVRLNWSYEDLLDAPVAHRGYYDAPGSGLREITAFMDNPDIGSDTNWVSIDGSPEPFGHDIWGDAGLGWPIIAVSQPDPDTYQWVDLVPFGAPDIQAGEIFGIAIKNAHPDITSEDFGVSYWYGDMDIGGWKYYSNGRLTLDETAIIGQPTPASLQMS